MIEENQEESLFDKIEFEDSPTTVFFLSWIELEILKFLKNSSEPVYKGEMINYLRKKHIAIENKPESSFYAIFDKLEKENYILSNTIPGKGYKTFLEVTEKGTIELKHALYWAVSTIFEGMVESLIDVLNDVCVKNMGCLREMNYAIVSPNNPEFLVSKACSSCIDVKEENTLHRYNILMPYSENTSVNFYQNIQAKPTDIPLKDGLMDRIMSVLSLGLIETSESKSFISEVHRLLKPGGKAAFVELITFESYLFDALQQLTNGFSSFIPKKIQNGFMQFTHKEVMSKLEEVFGEGNIELVDLREFVLAIAKKM